MIAGSSRRLRAVEAKSYAQYLAFAPFAFQTALVMRDTGLLAALEKGSEKGEERQGQSLQALAEASGLSEYAVSVLVDFGLNLDLVKQDDAGHYLLGEVGFFMLNDEMTRVNFNFTRDVAYEALPHLEASLREGRPAGLKTLGPWETIYEGLTRLPQPAQQSWFEFDHHYSDRIFDQLLPLVFEQPVRHLLDVGGNTGRWARKCLEYDAKVQITMMDLPQQLDRAKEQFEAAGLLDRVHFNPADVLKADTQFPTGMDAIWMSQFLDCFSEPEIIHILTRAADAMDENCRLYIVELFPDRQAFDAARYSLDATSLYFTCLANGNSRMYHHARFIQLVESAGLKIEASQDIPSGGHTFMRCRKA